MQGNETSWRFAIFLIVLIGVAVWENWQPRRKRSLPRATRWTRNLGIVVIDNLAVRILGPISAAAAATFATNYNIGVFNWINLGWIAVIISIVLLDMVIYWQHVIFHRVPWLWRLHMVHHVDQDIDVTTGIRFHPIEIILSILVKVTAVMILGVPFVGVVLFEILLNAMAMFNHGNIKLPSHIDRIVRLFTVTPDMHRVHHSTVPRETHSNFGFNLPWWDRIFGTYRDQPELGHDDMVIGLPQHQDATKTGLLRMLTIPFERRK